MTASLTMPRPWPGFNFFNSYRVIKLFKKVFFFWEKSIGWIFQGIASFLLNCQIRVSKSLVMLPCFSFDVWATSDYLLKLNDCVISLFVNPARGLLVLSIFFSEPTFHLIDFSVFLNPVPLIPTLCFRYIFLSVFFAFFSLGYYYYFFWKAECQRYGWPLKMCIKL